MTRKQETTKLEEAEDQRMQGVRDPRESAAERLANTTSLSQGQSNELGTRKPVNASPTHLEQISQSRPDSGLDWLV